MAPKFNTGDIVIVDTEDAISGKVVVPGIVRYAVLNDAVPNEDSEAMYYEVNVFVDNGNSPADMENCKWWALSENEMRPTGLKAQVDRMPAKPKGPYTYTGIRF